MKCRCISIAIKKKKNINYLLLTEKNIVKFTRQTDNKKLSSGKIDKFYDYFDMVLIFNLLSLCLILNWSELSICCAFKQKTSSSLTDYSYLFKQTNNHLYL